MVRSYLIPALKRRCWIGFRFNASVGLRFDAATPDETTICRFRNALKDEGLGEALFAEVLPAIGQGRLHRQDRHVDRRHAGSQFGAHAALGFDAPGSGEPAASDPDANWTREGGNGSFFWLQGSRGVDQGSGLVRSRLLTPAKVYESEVADSLIVGDEKAVYADKAYEKKARRDALKARGVKDRIQHRRNKHQKVLPHWQKVRNQLIRRIRGAVERTFSVLKRRYGWDRARYGGLKANAFHLDLSLIAFNLRTAAAKAA